MRARRGQLARRQAPHPPVLANHVAGVDTRAEQRRIDQVVVARVVGAVANAQVLRDRPLVVGEHRPDVARGVGHCRKRRGVAALIALQAVRHAQLILVRTTPATRCSRRRGSTNRGRSGSSRRARVQSPWSPTCAPTEKNATLLVRSIWSSSPGLSNAPVVSRSTWPSSEISANKRPRGPGRSLHGAAQKFERIRERKIVVGRQVHSGVAVAKHAALQVPQAPGQVGFAALADEIGGDGLSADGGGSHPGFGNPRNRRFTFAAQGERRGAPDGGAHFDDGAADGEITLAVRANEVGAGRQLAERVLTELVGNGKGGRAIRAPKSPPHPAAYLHRRPPGLRSGRWIRTQCP